MSSTQVIDDENYIKLGRIIKILKQRNITEDVKITKIKEIIDSNFDINYKLPSNSLLCQNEPQYSGNTVLHFAVIIKPFEKACFILLIEHGADITIQNDNGFSPLLFASNNHSITDYDLLLFTQVKKGNSVNFHDKNGLSHFHVACSTNNSEVVDFFLKTGASVNERINDHAPNYRGYTPLHFALQNDNTFQTIGISRTIELLLNNGANMNSKDANGITPLHLLLKNLRKCVSSSNIFKILPSIILPDDIGLTYLHVGCISDDENLITIIITNLVNRFKNQNLNIDSPIKFNSPLWPGCTPLHVAANFNFKTVILLLEQGANLLAQDASGTTPLDLCMEKYKLHQIIQILSAERRYQLAQIKLTDGTKLLDVLGAMINNNEYELFSKNKIVNVNISIPFESILWPGDNLLHLAIRFKYYIKHLLSHNVDFTMVNANGMSPLHLAYYLNSPGVIEILKLHENISLNPVDRNNVSHLHIACAAQHYPTVEILLQSGANTNLPTLRDIRCMFCPVHKTGTTPFHLAIEWMNKDLRDKFLAAGADFNVADADGQTPLDIYFKINTTSLCGEAKRDCQMMFEQLLNSQKKITVTSKMGLLILYEVYQTNTLPEYHKVLIQKFIEEKKYKELGLTKLIVACALGSISMVKNELESGADVNQSITHVSDLWSNDPGMHLFYRQAFFPGDTALHLISRRKKINFKIAELLLEYGANPNLKNADNMTPVHLLEDSAQKAEILLSSKKFPIENPVNNDGLSHFHLCCKTNNFDLVDSYLKAGVNVNATVNYFADFYAGYTPLHFAIEHCSQKIIELLIEYGADPHIEAADGLTPLHMAIKDINISYNQLIPLLRSQSTDIQATRLIGNTVLESIFKNYRQASSNYISSNFTKKVELLIQSGCELNYKDISGQTILHKASNTKIIDLLLSLGADINIKDDEGQTPYNYHINKKDFNLESKNVFINHIKKLKSVGLYIDQTNQIACNEDFANNKSQQFTVDEIEKEKSELDVKLFEQVDLSISVDYFYSEKFVVNYWRMTAQQRQSICKICNSIDLRQNFPITYDLIKLQFGKARSRTRLLEPAGVALQSLVDLH